MWTTQNDSQPDHESISLGHGARGCCFGRSSCKEVVEMSWKRGVNFPDPVLIDMDTISRRFKCAYETTKFMLPDDPQSQEAAFDMMVTLVKHFHEGYFQLVF